MYIHDKFGISPENKFRGFHTNGWKSSTVDLSRDLSSGTNIRIFVITILVTQKDISNKCCLKIKILTK